MAFDITPTTAEDSEIFTNALGESMTITLYRADGSGLLPGMSMMIQRQTSGGWANYDAVTHTRDGLIWDAIGTWRLFKPASDVAYGAKGN